MKHLSVAAVLAIALLTAVPTLASPLSDLALASPLTAQGVTRELMVEIMTRHGLPARIDKDSKGNVIVKSRVAETNFDVYFFEGLREVVWVFLATSERWKHACEHLEPQIFLVA